MIIQVSQYLVKVISISSLIYFSILIFNQLFIKQMINVYSFQKMAQPEDVNDDKAISKTSQFVFGQNYKKLVANSKASFDFRRFLKNHSNSKKHHTTITHKETSGKRNPLEEVANFQVNTQHNIQSKAFKIRCYSRKNQKENQREDEVIVSKLIRYRPKIYPMKQTKVEEKRTKTNFDSKKSIKMHKFDNFQELQSIANGIKVIYNDDQAHQNQKNSQKAIVFDTNYLIACMKAANSSKTQKDRDVQHFRKKLVFLLKKIIEDKYNPIPISQPQSEQRPQIIFKTRSEEQTYDLLDTLNECGFSYYHAVFYVQQKYVQSVSTYALTRINGLAQNVTLVDNLQSLTYHLPLLNSRHFIGFCTFNEKSNFGNAMQSLFHQLQNLDIRFSPEQFQNQDLSQGGLVQMPYRQLLSKVRQRKTLKQRKKSSRQKKQRCHSSYEGSNTTSSQRRLQDKNMQCFKQKMLKYLKIINNESPATLLQTKKSRQLSSYCPSTNTTTTLLHHPQDIDCLTGRQKHPNSKTNNQIVSELIRLNSHVNKQVAGYLKKVEEFGVGEGEEEIHSVGGGFARFQKVFVNVVNG